MVAEWYLRMVRTNIKPPMDMVRQHGFDEGRRMIEKAYLRDTNPMGFKRNGNAKKPMIEPHPAGAVHSHCAHSWSSGRLGSAYI